MKTLRFIAMACVGLGIASAVGAQEPPKPGPEHERLRRQEGTWEATVKTPGGESKGTTTAKMDLGGLWLVSDFQGEFFGQKFQGKGLDTYDPAKKKYVTIWIDSMSTFPMIMEGTYDKGGKVLTMLGEGPSMSGKIEKMKTTTEFKDEDTMVFVMSNPDTNAEMMTITYKRKK